MSRLPLGQRESSTLEFKAQDALDRPERIAREVVGMLNAGGGEVWIGIAERDGVAVEIEPIADAQRRADSLRDFLVDTIEPSPVGDEVRVSVMGEVLCVAVKPGARKPYAELRLKEGKWRLYTMRVADRLRPMTRDELSEHFSFQAARERDTLEASRRRMAQARDEALSQGGGLSIFVSPLGDHKVDLQHHEDEITSWLRDPTLTGNRRSGWTFALEGLLDVVDLELHGDAYEAGNPYRRTRFEGSGTIVFHTPIETLYWEHPRGIPERTLYPVALLEYPTSVVRLAKHAYETFFSFADDVPILVDMVLAGARGWKLHHGSLDRITYGRMNDEHELESDVVAVEPLEMPWRDFCREPDRAAFRLLRKVYAACGFREQQMPPWFLGDPLRLQLPYAG